MLCIYIYIYIPFTNLILSYIPCDIISGLCCAFIDPVTAEGVYRDRLFFSLQIWYARLNGAQPRPRGKLQGCGINLHVMPFSSSYPVLVTGRFRGHCASFFVYRWPARVVIQSLFSGSWSLCALPAPAPTLFVYRSGPFPSVCFLWGLPQSSELPGAVGCETPL